MYTLKIPPPSIKNADKNGSALLVTLLVTSLLLVVVLTFVVVVRMEIRNLATHHELLQARANARLGANLAIARLQELTGPDQRVTAPAEILTAGNHYGAAEGGVVRSGDKRHWVGVWDASTFDPFSPNEKTFLGWLVSGPSSATASLGAVAGDLPGYSTNPNYIALLGNGSVRFTPPGDPNDPGRQGVKLGRSPVVNPDLTSMGHFAFWVGDEGTKARFDLVDPHVNAPDRATRRFSRLSMQRYGIETMYSSFFGGPIGNARYAYRNPAFTRLFDRLASAGHVDFLPGFWNTNFMRDNFHHLTLFSEGVLANVVEGGLKKDLTLAFEMDLADFNASEFAQVPASISGVYDSTAAAVGHNVGYLFVLDAFNTAVQPNNDKFGNRPIVRGPPWHLLRNFYRLYKENDPDRSVYGLPVNSGVMNRDSHPIVAGSWAYPRPIGYNYGYRGRDDFLTASRVRHFNATGGSGSGGNEFDHPAPIMPGIEPVILRYQMIVSLEAIPCDDNPSTPEEEAYQIRFHIDPVLTLWNPYNVAIRTGGGDQALRVLVRGLPPSIGIRIYSDKFRAATGVTRQDWRFTLHGLFGDEGDIGANAMYQLNIAGGEGLTMQPGEILVFTAAGAGQLLDLTGGNQPSLTMTTNFANLPEEGGFFVDEIQLQPRNPDGSIVPGNERVPGILKVPDDAELSIRLSAFPQRVQQVLHFGDGTTVAEQHVIYDVPVFGYTSNYQRLDFRGDAQGTYHIKFPGLIDPGSIWPDPENQNIGRPVVEIDPALSGGFRKTSVGYFDVYQKPEDDEYPVNMLAHYNPRGYLHGQGIANGYDLSAIAGTDNWRSRTQPLPDPNSLANAIRVDPNARGIWGSSVLGGGETHVPLFGIPVAPILSVADLQHAPVSRMGDDPSHPIGNSFSSPYVPRNAFVHVREYAQRPFENNIGKWTTIDWSYLSNQAIFDGYYFSGLAPAPSLGHGDSLEAFLAWVNGDPVLSGRFQLYLGDSPDPATVQSALFDGPLIRPDAYRILAEHLTVRGMFNVNSTSVPAWQALLSGTRELAVDYFEQNSYGNYTADGAVFGRMLLSNAPANELWQGLRDLTDAQIRTLAENIVDQVRERGPFLSLSEFVNRRLAADPTGVKGALQAAIDTSNINAVFHENLAEAYAASGSSINHLQYVDNGALLEKVATGVTGFLTQADLLSGIAPQLSARSDTFRIRAYGDYTPSAGGEAVRAWCEVIVQRVPTLHSGFPDDNHRQIKVVSFRWLTEDEV